MATYKLNTSKDEIEHFNRLEQYADDILKVLFEMAVKLITLGYIMHRVGIVKAIPEKRFSFPKLNAEVNKALKEAAAKMGVKFSRYIGREWDFRNMVDDAFLKKMFPKIPETALAKFKVKNLNALAAFQKRKKAGLNLSQRVWNLATQSKAEIELLLDKGISEGQSAASLKHKLKQYLNNPDKFLPKGFKPGQGVYRSSLKNAERLARTEINHAYRMAAHTRIQQLPFVVGIKISRSNNYSDCDVCNSMEGVYPKDFVWTGWHPSCRCKQTSVLMTDAEMNKMEDAILNDGPLPTKSVNTVSQMNSSAKDWWDKNKTRVKDLNSLPYFIADNPQYFKIKQ